MVAGVDLLHTILLQALAGGQQDQADMLEEMQMAMGECMHGQKNV